MVKKFIARLDLFVLKYFSSPKNRLLLLSAMISALVINILVKRLFGTVFWFDNGSDLLFLFTMLIFGRVNYSKQVKKNYLYWFCWDVIAISTVYKILIDRTFFHEIPLMAAIAVMYFIPHDDDDDGGTRKRIEELKEDLRDRSVPAVLQN